MAIYLGVIDSVPYLVRVAPEVYREAYSCGTVFAPAFPRDGRGPCTDLLNNQLQFALLWFGLAVVSLIIGAAKQSSNDASHGSQSRSSGGSNVQQRSNPVARPSAPPVVQGVGITPSTRSAVTSKVVTPTNFTGAEILAYAEGHGFPTEVVDAARKASLFSATINAWCFSTEPSCLLLVYGDQIWRFNSFYDWTRLTLVAEGFVSDDAGKVVSLRVGTTLYSGLTPPDEADRLVKVLRLRELSGATTREVAPTTSLAGIGGSEADPVAGTTHARTETTVRERLQKLRTLIDDGLITAEPHDARVNEILREL